LSITAFILILAIAASAVAAEFDDDNVVVVDELRCDIAAVLSPANDTQNMQIDIEY
jgi:hypothetical protein